MLVLASSVNSAVAREIEQTGTASNLPLTSAFSYQGQLKNINGAVNGVCDFQFTLWEAADASASLATRTHTNVSVTNGLFTIPDLEFGNVFYGFQRWLGIAVRCPSGSGDYTTLTPRQAISAVPYALYAVGIPLAGSGYETTAARSDHDHELAYWELGGNEGLNGNNAVLGTNTAVTLTFSVNQSPVLRLIPTLGIVNVIGGSKDNYVMPGAMGVTIFGGGGSYYRNSVTDDYGTVSGGYANRAGDNDVGTTEDAPYATVGGGDYNWAGGYAATIAGGHTNIITDAFGTIGGGEFNRAAGDDTVAGGRSNEALGGASVIGGGGQNRATAAYSTISGGIDNVASGRNSSVPGGNGALASHYGELAYASGRWDQTGDAQTSLYVLRQSTTTGEALPLLLDGANERLTIASDRTVTFDILIVARSNTNLSAGYQIRGVIENSNGVTALVGAPVVTTLGAQNNAWSVTAEADDVNDALDILVTGIAGLNIRWVASVHTVEVAWME